MIVAFLAALLIPGIGAIRRQAAGTRCLSNVRILGNGILTYAVDHNGLSTLVTYTPNANGELTAGVSYLNVWKFMGYVKSSDRPRCPLMPESERSNSYSYNYAGGTGLVIYYPKLVGIPWPSSKVVIATEYGDSKFRWDYTFTRMLWGNSDGPPETPKEDGLWHYHGTAQRRGLNMMFLDGHAELVVPEKGTFTRKTGADIPAYGNGSNHGFYYDERQFAPSPRL